MAGQSGQSVLEVAPVVAQLEGRQGGHLVLRLRDGRGFSGHRRLELSHGG
jgi:hypothetical protein